MITGQFIDYNKNVVTVNIYCDADRTIGSDGLLFTGDPLSISTTNEDEFNVIIRKKATINLATDSYLGDILYAANAKDIKVEIFKGDDCIFYGFISPTTFNQPYSKPLDEFSITCIDYLSTLQYYNYNNTTANSYDEDVSNTTNVSYLSIMNSIFKDIEGSIYYDMSKGITKANTDTVFKDLCVNEKVFYGDEYDDVMTQQEVLEEILKYLNLHIIQEGKDFYIFDYESIKNGNTQWYDDLDKVTIPQSTINLTGSLHADSDTNVSIDDVYNQIELTDNLTKMETVIDSPLDEDNLSNPYGGKQKYLTEYYGIGWGTTPLNNYMATIRGGSTSTGDEDKYGYVDYYMEYLQNPNWKFFDAGGNDISVRMETDSSGKYINQHNMAKYLHDNNLTGSIFKFYRKAYEQQTKDDSVSNNFYTKTCMYISVNGNECNNETLSTPTADEIYSRIPTVEYTSTQGGGVYSPIDEDTTNYLVFSGKICLQPKIWETGISHVESDKSCYNEVKAGSNAAKSNIEPIVPNYDWPFPIADLGILNGNTVPSKDNGHGKYYSRRFYEYTNTTDKSPKSETTDYVGIQPLDTTDYDAMRGLQFNYCKYGDSNYGKVDKFKKLPVLQCELIIGDKRLVEYNITEDGNSEFGWFTDNNLPTVTIDGETVELSTFTLGVNPAIGDYLVGKEYDLQNTIDETFGLDNGVEGTAIPIKKSDSLTGQLKFRILGLVNTVWNDVVRINHSFWRRHSWKDNDKPILSHVQNVIIEDFECKIYSNNGGLSLTGDNDLIYVSAEQNKYIEKKDDVEFNIVTQLTSSEALSKGVASSINLNAAINGSTNLPITSIYNSITKETAKAEEHYVDYYYREYSKPRMIMETTLHNKNEIKWNDLIFSKQMNKKFFIMNVDYDVKKNNKTLKLKEYD